MAAVEMFQLNVPVENEDHPPLNQRLMLNLQWNDLSFSPSPKKNWRNRTVAPERLILGGVSGTAHSGQLIAILGPSGAGKTTLLNVLAGRHTSKGRITGTILLNGQPRDPHLWRTLVGYVEQTDLLYETLTVQETLQVAADLRLPMGQYNSRQRKERVERIVHQLGLDNVRNTRLGGVSHRGISGGELKRTSIGVELVTDPSIVFCDEPTSGLDSFTAFAIVQLLRRVSTEQQKLILITIHQPRYTILELFDTIILMAQGKVAFIGSVPEAMHHFTQMGFPVPLTMNPSDHFLDTITQDKETNVSARQTQERIDFILQRWSTRQLGEPARNISTTYPPLTSTEALTEYARVRKLARNPIWREFVLLWHRDARNLLRGRRFIYAGIFQCIFITTLMGLVFLQLGYSQVDIQSRTGLLSFVIINLAFGTVNPVVNLFPAERSIIVRERYANSYRATPALLSKFFVLAPFGFITTTIYGAALFWMTNLSTNAGTFAIFMLFVYVLNLFSLAMGLAFGAASPDIHVAQIMATTILIFFVIFGGPFVNTSTIPVWLAWLQWVSPITYAFRGLAQAVFRDATFTCTDAPVPNACLTTGMEVLVSRQITTPSLWPSWLILIGFTFFTIACACLFLSLGTRPKRMQL